MVHLLRVPPLSFGLSCLPRTRRRRVNLRSRAQGLTEENQLRRFPAAVGKRAQENVNTASDNVMPAFGTNPNVMCYLDDIFIYLRARANEAVPRGRPAKHEEKPKAVGDAENRCLGGK